MSPQALLAATKIANASSIFALSAKSKLLGCKTIQRPEVGDLHVRSTIELSHTLYRCELERISTTTFSADEVGAVILGWLKSTANLIAVEAPKVSSKYGLKIHPSISTMGSISPPL